MPDAQEAVIYELQQLSLNAVTFTGLTKLGRLLAGWVQWFPKADVHYIVLILLTVFSISKDKRIFFERPPFPTQAVRLGTNVILLFAAQFLMSLICDFNFSPTDGQTDSMSMKCAWGVVGELMANYVYRILNLGFLRVLIIVIQVFNNAYYRLELW